MQPTPPPRARALQVAAVIIAVALVYVLAVGLRWWISSTVEIGMRLPGTDELPYTLESALLFHYADEYRKTGNIPRVDERAQVPEGLHVWRDLSLGKGIVAAWFYNGAGVRGISFRQFVRRFDAAWYCLGVIPLFLLVLGRTRSLVAASLASLLLACAYTAIVRSTGLEFSRENFALPLIFAHFWLLDLGLRRRRLGPSVAAALVLAVALTTWDLTQLYLLFVVAYWVVRCLVRRAAAAQLVHLVPTIAACFLVGLVVPYLWSHSFVVSYAMLVGYGLLAWWLLEKRARLPAPVAKGALVLVLVGALIAASALPAGKTYGHFRRLFFAKLSHLNVKPEDPERLDYDARIMWTPALHSATTTYMGRRPIADFAALFLLSLIAAGCVVAAKLKRRNLGELSLLVAMVIAWLVLYVLFVRMQVFLVFFLAAFVGIGIGALRTLGGPRGLIAVSVPVWAVVVGTVLHVSFPQLGGLHVVGLAAAAGIGIGALLALARMPWSLAMIAPVVTLFLISDLGQKLFLGQADERYKLYVPESMYDLYENPHFNKTVANYGCNFEYGAAAVLVDWLKANTPEDAVVLASFSLDAMIFAHAGRRIVLHPKFENPVMRNKVRAFVESFYAPSERRFYEFCVRNQVDYFVLNVGMFTTPGVKYWVYSPRYIAASTGDLYETVGTSWMYKDPDKCGYFRFRTEIGAKGELAPLYRIFEVVPQRDIEEAGLLARGGARFLENYKQSHEQVDIEFAADALEKAVEAWPGCMEAWRLMVTVYALLGNEERALEAKARWDTLEQQERQQP